jgi:hypothetical protein
MTALEIAAIPDPANGLMVYNTSDEHVYVFTQSVNLWKRVVYDTNWINPPFSCGLPFTVNHIAGDIAPVNKIVTYGTVLTDLTGSSKCWITQNLGADHQATFETDATEASAGWYWQFDFQQGYKHSGAVRTPNTTWISSWPENSDWQPDIDPCTLLLGSGWRIPTLTEWNNADINGGWNNYFDTYASVLAIHAAGDLNSTNGQLENRGASGYYWSSTQYQTHLYGYGLFAVGGCEIGIAVKAFAFTVRCLTD